VSEPSISAKKLKLTVEDHASKQPPSVDGCRIIDLHCFMNSLMSATVCGTCKTHQMKITEEVVTSIASTFLLACPCGATLHIFTSKKLSSDGTNSLQSAFELNQRLVFAFRTIGLGYTYRYAALHCSHEHAVYYVKAYIPTSDLLRIYQMNKKSSDDGRAARKRNRRKKKAKEDESVSKGGVTFGPGEF